jgi:hypothetical protein
MDGCSLGANSHSDNKDKPIHECLYKYRTQASVPCTQKPNYYSYFALDESRPHAKTLLLQDPVLISFFCIDLYLSNRDIFWRRPT